MNRSDARAIDTGFGWQAQYRLCWKSKYETLMKKAADGTPTDKYQYFETEQEAEIAAWREKNDIEQPMMRRSGPTLLKAHQEAEAHFTIRKAGRKPVVVERVGARA